MHTRDRQASTIDCVFLTDVELAQRWNMSPKTLRNARVAGGHVPFVRIGRLVRYSLNAVLEYEQRHTLASTSQDTKRSG